MSEDEKQDSTIVSDETAQAAEEVRAELEAKGIEDAHIDETARSEAAESIIAPTTDEEVAAYRAEHGGMVVHAREAVDKLHLLEAAAEVKVTGDAHDLAEIVEALVERLPG